MTKKILCPTDGSDHATRGLHIATELAKLTGAHLTICVVNIAHGGVRGPTINHWTNEDAAKLIISAGLVYPPDKPAVVVAPKGIQIQE